jgi:enoyl-CoA hydratase/carnithine racemase
MIATKLQDGIVEILINNSRLMHSAGGGLSKAIADAQTNAVVRVIVIRGGGKFFSGGARFKQAGKLNGGFQPSASGFWKTTLHQTPAFSDVLNWNFSNVDGPFSGCEPWHPLTEVGCQVSIAELSRAV